MTCADYNDILNTLDDITVEVQVTSEFFSPKQYVDHGTMPLQVDYERGNLNSLFSQDKQLNVAQDAITFKRSWFNNKWPGYGEDIKTYFVQSEGYGVTPIAKEQSDTSTGFMNY